MRQITVETDPSVIPAAVFLSLQPFDADKIPKIKDRAARRKIVPDIETADNRFSS